MIRAKEKQNTRTIAVRVFSGRNYSAQEGSVQEES